MAIKIPSQEEIKQFLYDIDQLEGYSYSEWLDYMEDEYPNVDAAELYASKGENIVTGYRDIRGNFVAGDEPVIDDDILALIKDSVDNRPSEIGMMNTNIKDSAATLDAMSTAEKSALNMEILKDKAENPEAYETIMMDQPEVEQFTEGAIDGDTGEFMMASPEEIEALGDTPIDPLDPMGISQMIMKYANDAGIDPTLALVMSGLATRNPSTILKPKSSMLSTKNSRVLKEVPKTVGNVVSKKKVPISKSTIDTKNSRVLKETDPKVSTQNSRVLKQEKNVNTDIVTKQANAAKVKAIANTRNKLTNKDKLVTAGITSAAAIAALTNQNQLTGERDTDGSLMIADSERMPYVRGEDTHVMPDGTVMKDSDHVGDMPPYEKSIDNRDISSKSIGKPGWTLDGKGGNYLSANFDDDYWNTPEGIEEAIGIWGRPIGNKIGNTGLFN